MTLSERRNYWMATLASILFHLALLWVYIPEGFLNGNAKAADGIEIYSAGLVAITSDNKPLAVRNVKPASSAPASAAKTSTKARQETRTETVIPARSRPTAKKSKPIEAEVKEKPVAETTPKSSEPAVSSPVEEVTGHSKTQEIVPGESGVSGGEGRSLGDGSGFVTKRGLFPLLRPIYPKDAENVGREGNVSLRIMILSDGSVQEVGILESSGDTRLDRAAVNFVSQEWAFKPHSESYYIDVVFIFKMHVPVTHRFLNAQTRP